MNKRSIFILILAFFVLVSPIALANGSVFGKIVEKTPGDSAAMAQRLLADSGALSDADKLMIASAKSIYQDEIVPTLLFDKAAMLSDDITEEMMKEAIIIGPILIFDQKGKKNITDTASLISDVDFAQRYAFFAMSEDKPLCFFMLGQRDATYFVAMFTGSRQAQDFMDCCKKLGRSSLKDIILLRIQGDNLFVSSDDKIMLEVSAMNPKGKTYSFDALTKAISQRDKYNKENPGLTGNHSLADYLEGNIDLTAKSNLAKDNDHGNLVVQVILICSVLGVTAITFSIIRKRRHTKSVRQS